MDIKNAEYMLNCTNMPSRLTALRTIKQEIDNGNISLAPCGTNVNNHIHTIYSFSPYSPTAAVWEAKKAGLATAGIMDHDSISGAEEFLEAAQIMNIGATIGIEIRVKMNETPFNGRLLNNPDQRSIAYMGIHSIPHSMINQTKDFLKPIGAARKIRNQKMTARLNEIFAPYGISMDYEKDIEAISQYSEGGSVTERHILFALARKIMEKYTPGEELISFMTNTLGIALSAKQIEFLSDTGSKYYDYDLLNILKGVFVSRFYIDATDECVSVFEAVDFAKSIGAISAYAYLGDVTASVTGDKKAQTFEDSYLDELVEYLADIKFNAITYMPARNTMDQLIRLRSLCDKHNLFQISGEDINQPRQKFLCPIIDEPMFANLKDAAWALIGNENEATRDIGLSMFSAQSAWENPNIKDRVAKYSELGRLYVK